MQYSTVSSDVVLVGAASSGTMLMLYRYSNCLVLHTPEVKRCHYPTYDKRTCKRAGGGGRSGRLLWDDASAGAECTASRRMSLVS